MVYFHSWQCAQKCIRPNQLHNSLFTRWRSLAEYWKYFMARFNDVHAFGYNSAGSEHIWMKFWGTPSILFGAGPDRFWARFVQNRSESGRPCGSFVFLSGKQRTTVPSSGQPNFTKFAQDVILWRGESFREKFSAICLWHLVPWPSVDSHWKFYGDRPRGTPPPRELNTKG